MIRRFHPGKRSSSPHPREGRLAAHTSCAVVIDTSASIAGVSVDLRWSSITKGPSSRCVYISPFWRPIWAVSWHGSGYIIRDSEHVFRCLYAVGILSLAAKAARVKRFRMFIYM